MSAVCLSATDLALGYRSARDGKFVLACDGIDLEIADHEFVAVVGPSGSGKTTFLEAVAGLVPIAGGTLELHDRPITAPGPERALVFQRPSLFPWRNVLSNILFGLEAQRRAGKDARARARDLLNLVGLDNAERKYPHELSGGMMQRANLARALATDPALLLLDEPFGALDAQTRETLQEELLRIWESGDNLGQRKTAVFITHDVAEAVLLSDRVIVFSGAPASVARTIVVNAPRPRQAAWRRSPEFFGHCDEIVEALQSQPGPSRSAA